MRTLQKPVEKILIQTRILSQRLIFFWLFFIPSFANCQSLEDYFDIVQSNCFDAKGIVSIKEQFQNYKVYWTDISAYKNIRFNLEGEYQIQIKYENQTVAFGSILVPSDLRDCLPPEDLNFRYNLYDFGIIELNSQKNVLSVDGIKWVIDDSIKASNQLKFLYQFKHTGNHKVCMILESFIKKDSICKTINVGDVNPDTSTYYSSMVVQDYSSTAQVNSIVEISKCGNYIYSFVNNPYFPRDSLSLYYTEDKRLQNPILLDSNIRVRPLNNYFSKNEHGICFNNEFYFINQKNSKYELLKTQTSILNTSTIKVADYDSYPFNFKVINDTLKFNLNSESGTIKISSNGNILNEPRTYYNELYLGNKAFQIEAFELIKYEGSNRQVISPLNFVVSSFILSNNRLYFYGKKSSSLIYEIWSTDGNNIVLVDSLDYAINTFSWASVDNFLLYSKSYTTSSISLNYINAINQIIELPVINNFSSWFSNTSILNNKFYYIHGINASSSSLSVFDPLTGHLNQISVLNGTAFSLINLDGSLLIYNNALKSIGNHDPQTGQIKTNLFIDCNFVDFEKGTLSDGYYILNNKVIKITKTQDPSFKSIIANKDTTLGLSDSLGRLFWMDKSNFYCNSNSLVSNKHLTVNQNTIEYKAVTYDSLNGASRAKNFLVYTQTLPSDLFNCSKLFSCTGNKYYFKASVLYDLNTSLEDDIKVFIFKPNSQFQEINYQKDYNIFSFGLPDSLNYLSESLVAYIRSTKFNDGNYIPLTQSPEVSVFNKNFLTPTENIELSFVNNWEMNEYSISVNSQPAIPIFEKIKKLTFSPNNTPSFQVSFTNTYCMNSIVNLKINICNSDIAHTSAIIPSNYYSTNNIISMGTGHGLINYNAGKQILLNLGFSISGSNSVFNAQIKVCVPD
jgi:hypothetical protein